MPIIFRYKIDDTSVVVLFVLCLGVFKKIFVLLAPCVCFRVFGWGGWVAACWGGGCSFGLRFVSWYMCLIVGLVFSHLGFWSGSLFLIAPFPDLCLLVPLINARDALCCLKCKYILLRACLYYPAQKLLVCKVPISLIFFRS